MVTEVISISISWCDITHHSIRIRISRLRGWLLFLLLSSIRQQERYTIYTHNWWALTTTTTNLRRARTFKLTNGWSFVMVFRIMVIRVHSFIWMLFCLCLCLCVYALFLFFSFIMLTENTTSDEPKRYSQLMFIHVYVDCQKGTIIAVSAYKLFNRMLIIFYDWQLFILVREFVRSFVSIAHRSQALLTRCWWWQWRQCDCTIVKCLLHACVWVCCPCILIGVLWWCKQFNRMRARISSFLSQ